MKPADHPEFFLRPAPSGGSRESSLRLDREGRFWHEGEPVERPALVRALHAWLGEHPLDGRAILSNGYDWCYVEVEDTSSFVQSVCAPSASGQPPRLVLASGEQEALDPSTLVVDDQGVLYARVGPRGEEARFGRLAQTELAEYLAPDDPPRVVLGSASYPIGRRCGRPGAAPPPADAVRS